MTSRVREKRGLLAAFAVFGVFWGSWAAVLPDVRERAGLDAPVRHRGLILGVDLVQVSHDAATRVAAECFARGLLAEPTGRHDTVLKMLPPLNVTLEHLQEASAVFGAALQAVLATPS